MDISLCRTWDCSDFGFVISDLDFEMEYEMDFQKLSLQKRLLQFARLYEKLLLQDRDSNEMTVEDEKLFEDLYKEIFTELISTPGTLLYFENPSEQKIAQVVIDAIYNILDPEEMFEEITSGGYSGLLVNIVSDYIDRVKLLKPTLISINPKRMEFKYYFEEAMKAWLHGVDNASLILCTSILENLLKSELGKIDVDLVYKFKKKNGEIIGVRSIGLTKLIENALMKKIIDNDDYKKANQIKNLRNDVVHELKSLEYQVVHNAILDTKNIIEKIMSK